MFMNYSEKLASPKWQRKRLHIFSRDNWRCVRCGDADSELHVHHLYYIRGKLPFQYPDSALQTICHACHQKEHEGDHHKRTFESVNHKRNEERIAHLASLFLKYIKDPVYRAQVDETYNKAFGLIKEVKAA